MSHAPLRERLRQRRGLLATFCIVPAVEMVEVAALAGFDVVLLDTEHGPYGVGALGPLVLAARARGASTMVRVSSGDPQVIGAALDAGADGVLVPQVGSPEAAAAAVSAARFAPEGTRGANPYVRAADFTSGPQWFAEANRRAAVMVMVEGEHAIAALDEMLDVPGLDGIFLGPVDLSHALGVPGELDHPRVRQQLEKVIAACADRGIASGVFAPTPEVASSWRQAGVTLIALGVDAAHALAGMRVAAEAARADGGISP